MKKKRRKAFREHIGVMELIRNTTCLQVSITVMTYGYLQTDEKKKVSMSAERK